MKIISTQQFYQFYHLSSHLKMLYLPTVGPFNYPAPHPENLSQYVKPAGRRNRRRERPGSRARNASQSPPAPSPVNFSAVHTVDHQHCSTYRPSPSPLLRQSFDAAWSRWKARENSISASSSASGDWAWSNGYGSWGAKGYAEKEIEERRIFGGEEEDIIGLDLCPAMLDVVKFLWGDVDYTDDV